MKKSFLKISSLMLLVVTIFFGACKKDPNLYTSVSEIGSATHSELSTELMDFLNCHGFNTIGATITDGQVTVEDDILISEEAIKSMINETPISLLDTKAVQERQHTNALVNGLLVSTTLAPNIQFYIDPSVASIPTIGTQWVAAIRTACQNWNAIPNCRINMTEVNSHVSAHISFFRDNNSTLPMGLQNLQGSNGGIPIAKACFPFAGTTGRYISINDDPRLASLTVENCRHTIRHEVGHTLGFRHNNSGASEGSGTDACGTTYSSPQLLAGTPADDALSVMNSGALTLNLSSNDLLAAQFLYPEYYSPHVINAVIPGNGLVTINTNSPSGQSPYRVLIGRYTTAGALVQGYEFLNPGNQYSFQILCPPGVWKFKTKRANFGSFTSDFSNEITATVLNNGIYKLTRKGTNQCLDAAGCGSANGTNVQLWQDNGYDCQRWIVTAQSDGSYELKRKGTTKNLDAAGCGSVNGTNVQLWEDNNLNCQRWIITKESDGFYELKRQGTTKNLDAANCGSTNGTNVQLWEDNSLDCQRWQMTFISQ